MIKYFLALVLSTLLLSTVFAQKRDTSVYYLKNSGKMVSSKDSADFFLVILPPDTSADKDLFIVKEFYPNGRLKLMSGSKNNNLVKFMFQGSYIAFYPNGHKMLISNYEKGRVVGDEIGYYPNGKLYNIKSYENNGKVFLKQFNDSTGSVLAENGKGKWKEYNGNFTAIDAEGEIDNGLEDGTWHGYINDSVQFESVFKKGQLLSTSKTYTHKSIPGTYAKVDTVPQFPGGFDAFVKFLSHNTRYMAVARENNIQGRVIISFVVEKDGSLTNVNVVRGIGGGCEEEVMRVIKSSTLWKPGILDGKIVRAAYNVSVNFTIQGNSGWITVDRQ